MSQQWLHSWFPFFGLLLQVILWSQFLSLHGSPELRAIVTGQPHPTDPDF